MTIFYILLSFQVIAQTFDRVPGFSVQSELSNATGVAVADYDLDGDLDLYIVASKVFDKDNPMTWSRLLRNDGAWGFTDVTIESNLINWQAETREGTMGSKMGASWGDYDNDGYPDIFISNYGLDELWHNEGDGTFRNVTESANVEGCFFCYSSGAVWWDYDLDGDLDLYVNDWLKENRFFRNDGNDAFVDISAVSGLNDRGHTFSSLPIDLNRDGLLDLYVVNDIGSNNFYYNSGNDQFVEATTQVGLSNHGNGMGIDICDYNNDGLFDIYVTNIYEYVPNPFFVNQGNGVFIDQSKQLGIDNTGWGWGTRFFDADHDLDEDLYVVNGFDSPIAAGDVNKFFENDNGRFTEVSSGSDLNSLAQGMGLEVFDYDKDGDQDIVVANREAQLDLFRNNTIETGESSNWIQIKLQGTIGNQNGLGATVKITCDDEDYYRYHSGVNVFSQSIKPIHYGLGNHQQVDQIQVDWPNGRSETFGPASTNQIMTLVEGTGEEVVADIVLNTTSGSTTEWKIYPNPYKEQVWMRLDADVSEPIQFALVDVMGKNVINKEIKIGQKGRIELLTRSHRIPPGVYFYSVSGKGLAQSGKLIKR